MIDVNDEGRIRHQAARRGFRVMRTRGREHKRRQQTGAGTYMLINQETNSVALFAATLEDIARFVEAHKRTQKQKLN
jgi:hypothetical protein